MRIIIEEEGMKGEEGKEEHEKTKQRRVSIMAHL
jgi:hypothetical protein